MKTKPSKSVRDANRPPKRGAIWCPARQLAVEAGLSIEQICRRAGTTKKGMNREYFLRLAKRGGASYYTARKLAAILDCDPLVFLWGWEQYQVFTAHSVKSSRTASARIRGIRDSEQLAGCEAL